MSTLHNRCTGGALQALTDNRLADTSKKGNKKSCVKITRLFPFELAGSYHHGTALLSVLASAGSERGMACFVRDWVGGLGV